ncbi:Hypothetical_protein [Hexamita inflata]|uniref:Hypothetical_protein n=1 Tax=Hexamita inflata TaxID=28002 RepID=A0AA86TSG4_9EUKA|nr:Hypothetical protein HINF_LOCUS14864 [Hexamita inflata]
MNLINFKYQQIRQKQHKYCLNFVINFNSANNLPNTFNEEHFEQISNFYFQNLIPSTPFKSELFKQLISSKRPSRSESLSMDQIPLNRFKMQQLETIEDYENQITEEENDLSLFK